MFAIEPLFASPDNSFGGPGLGVALLIGLISIVFWFVNLFLLLVWKPTPGKSKLAHTIALGASALLVLIPRGFPRHDELVLLVIVVFPIIVFIQFFLLLKVGKRPPL